MEMYTFFNAHRKQITDNSCEGSHWLSALKSLIGTTKRAKTSQISLSIVIQSTQILNLKIKQPLVSVWVKGEAKWPELWEQVNHKGFQTVKQGQQTEHPNVSEMLHQELLTLERERKQIQELISKYGYKLWDIFNMDETGLFMGMYANQILLSGSKSDSSLQLVDLHQTEAYQIVSNQEPKAKRSG